MVIPVAITNRKYRQFNKIKNYLFQEAAVHLIKTTKCVFHEDIYKILHSLFKNKTL